MYKRQIYTPGSDAGLPVSILGSLAAPKLSFDSDAEAIRDLSLIHISEPTRPY